MTPSEDEAVQRYFELHDIIKEAVRTDDYRHAVTLAKEAVSLIPHLVRNTKRQFGQFDIVESVAVENGGRLLAALGDAGGLRTMHETLTAVPETHQWASAIKGFIHDAEVGDQILEMVRRQPGVLQTTLRSSLPGVDSARVTELCYWLARVGRLKRTKRGRSYALLPT